MRITLKNIGEMENFAGKIVKDISKEVNRVNRETALLFCLSGHLGAGKTTLVKSVAKALGIKKHITSPTFVIIKSYALSPKFQKTGFKRLVHIDAYRLKKGKELLYLGFKDILKDKENLVFLEWPENVNEVLPEKDVKIKLEAKNEDSRLIIIKWPKIQKDKKINREIKKG